MPSVRDALALARTCHPGPTAAVTTLTALLSVAAGHRFGSGAVVTGAVFTGQLSIGWSNDLIDARRDLSTGRTDKPLARGEVSPQGIRVAIAVALISCVSLSLACGVASGAVHLLLGVAAGWAYNLGLKATSLSPVPYAVAFAALPAVVWLAVPIRVWPPLWMMAAGALLGVGLHLLNALPDLTDDEATGVRGLPHRMGAPAARWAAVLVLLAGSVITVLGPGAATGLTATTVTDWAGLAACCVLAVVAVRSHGRLPFVSAIGIAAVDVVQLVRRG